MVANSCARIPSQRGQVQRVVCLSVPPERCPAASAAAPSVEAGQSLVPERESSISCSGSSGSCTLSLSVCVWGGIRAGQGKARSSCTGGDVGRFYREGGHFARGCLRDFCAATEVVTTEVIKVSL